MDKEEISSMVACATVLPPTNSLSLAVQGAGFASGALASAWLGKGRGAGSLTTSSLVMSEAKKVVRVGLCGELQLGGLVCSFGCCARKQDRKGDQVQECRVYWLHMRATSISSTSTSNSTCFACWQPDKERGLMVLRKTRRLWTEAGGVTATRDISMVPVTILLLVEIARHF